MQGFPLETEDLNDSVQILKSGNDMKIRILGIHVSMTNTQLI